MAIVAALAASSSLVVWAQEPPAVVTPLDPLARYVRGAGPLADVDGGRIELLIEGDAAAVRVRAGGRTEVAPVADVSDALALLADPRAAAIWPALTEWAGADLSALRERRLA